MNLTDEQIEILARQSAEMTRLQARHSNELVALSEQHKAERATAKITLASVNQLPRPNQPG